MGKNAGARYCALYGCPNNSRIKPHLSFFSVPVCPDRRKQWLKRIGREELLVHASLQRTRVCEAHFERSDIQFREGRRVLTKTAMPKSYLTSVQENMRDKEVQVAMVEDEAKAALGIAVSSSPSEVNFDPQKRSKYLERYKFYELCNQFLSPQLSQFVKAYNFIQLSKTEDYDTRYKKFCWSLYFVSPASYNLFELLLGLPPITTLQKISPAISTQVTDDFLIPLKARVENMSEKEKQCSLIVGAFAVKPHLCYDIAGDRIVGLQEVDEVQSPAPAKHALVAFVRGLLVDWVQPLVFVLVSECKSYDNISKWIDKVILKLLEIGLNIRTLVSDLGSDLIQATRKECVSIEKPFFFVNDQHKIYHIIDTSYLVKDLCFHFKSSNFNLYKSSVASLQHIKQFYEFDKGKSLRLADELKDAHFELKPVDQMEARHAAQLLSRKVAAGVSTYVDLNAIDGNGKHTVKFLLLLNDVLDTLKRYSGDRAQKNLCTEFKKMISHMTITDNLNGTDLTMNVKFIEGFLMTINAVTLLNQDLKQDGYNGSVSRYLSQDIIELFLDKIRPKQSKATKVTCVQLKSRFQKLYKACILKPLRKRDDNINMAKFVEEIHNIALKCGTCKLPTEFNSDNMSSVFLEILPSHYNQFGLPENNSLLYICACLLKSCCERHDDCEQLKAYLSFSESRFRRVAEYRRRGGAALPAVPPDQLVEYVLRLEKAFAAAFAAAHPSADFGRSLYERILQQHPFEHPCPCFPFHYLLKLFVRMKIYSTVRFNNQTLRIVNKK